MKTPVLELYSLSNTTNKDDEINFRFNSPVSLDKFKSLFSLSNYDNSELNINYLSDGN
jgi:hypothetical protein